METTLDTFSEFTDMLDRNLRPGGVVIYSLPLDEKPGEHPHHKQTFTFQEAKEMAPYPGKLAFQMEGNIYLEDEYTAREGKRFLLAV